MEVTNTDKVKDISYLDDDGALQLSTTQQLAIKTLQERFEQRLERSKQLNLPDKLGKSELMYFCKQRNKHRPHDSTTQPSIMINGTVIQPSKIIKHLGVYLDETLTFHVHTDDAAARGDKCLMSLTSLWHNGRGLLVLLSTYTALHLVRAAFLLKMFWVSPVWWTGSQYIIHHLELVYHRALCWASGLPVYISIRKLLLLTRSPPLRCLLNYLSG